MDKIMLQSKAGKSITIQLEKLHKKNIDTFKKKEEELKNKWRQALYQPGMRGTQFAGGGIASLKKKR